MHGPPEDPYFRNLKAHLSDLKPFLRLASQTRGVSMDIGANIGLTTMALACVSDTVHCFEPSEDFEYLQMNIEENGLKNCIAHRVAVSDSCGELDFHIPASSAGSHVVTRDHAAKTWTPTAKVSAVTLDSLGIKADFVKIDAEGYEPKILAGAKDLKTVFMEFNAWCLLVQRVDPFSFLHTLIDDFSVSVVRRKWLGVRLEPLSHEGVFTFLHGHIMRGCVDDLLLTH